MVEDLFEKVWRENARKVEAASVDPRGDRFGFSPDIGNYVQRGEKYYTVTGQVFEMGLNSVFRTMPAVAGSFENYADWSDEKRAAVLKKAKANTRKYERERKAKEKRNDKLRSSARAKLTDEEYQALIHWEED